MEFVYGLSSHDRVVNQLFGTEPAVADGKPLRCVVLAFVNRSGSNHIADTLKTTGRFAGFEEMLNDHVMRALAPKYEVATFADYIRRAHAEQVQDPGEIWGVKAGWMQLAMLFRTGIIPHVLSPHLIVVRRRDVLGQAISLMIAEQTQQWTSKDRDQGRTASYDGTSILRHLRGVTNSYATLEQVITLSGLPAYTVNYEDFLDRPNQIVSEIGMNVCGLGLLPRLERRTLSPQRSALNYEFRARFIAELGAMEWIGRSNEKA